MTANPSHRRPPAVLSSIAALLLLAACASDPEVTDGGFEDREPPRGQTPRGETSESSDGGSASISDPSEEAPGDPAPVGASLEFVTPQSVNFQQESSVNLVVRLVLGDDPIPDVNVEYAIPESQVPLAGGSFLAQRRARTNSAGEATVQLRSGDVAAQFQVRVSVPSNSDVDPLTFVVRVASKDSADYLIQPLYDGPRQLDSVELRLFDTGDGAARSCSAFNGAFGAYDDPSNAGGLSPAPLNVIQNDIPRFAWIVDRTEAPLTNVIAFGMRDGNAVAFGCADGLPLDDWVGLEIIVDVPMHNLYPSVAGNYRVESTISLYDALPSAEQDLPPVREILDFVLDFFRSPGATLVGLMEEIAGLQLTSGQRAIVSGLLDVLLDAVLPPGYQDFADSALEVERILKEFELYGRMNIRSEADINGLLATNNTLVFTGMYLEFRGNRESYNLEALGYRPLEGEFSGSIQLGRSAAQPDHGLQINPFSMTLRYGQIINFILENIIIPEFFNVTGFDGLIRQFVDCVEIGQRCGGLNNLCESVCNTAVDALADTIRDQIGALETDTDNVFILQTPDNQPCPMHDNTGNFQIDELGREFPTSARCDWQGQFRWNVNQPLAADMPGTFFGIR